MKPEYLIGEMNINSAVTQPGHGELVRVEGKNQDEQVVEFRGFAYSGGGRRVIMVELSLDGGRTWEPAEFVPHPMNKPNSSGKCWTWRLWRFPVPLARLVCTEDEDQPSGEPHETCPTIKVRAWDSSFNTQPEGITWNVLGMMNNSQYTVRLQRCRDHEGRGALTFFHPQPPHEINFDKSFGRPPCEVEDRARPQVGPSKTAGKKGRFTKKEVATHNKEDDCWLIINGQVFDVTTFLNDHPGGAGIITINGGEVCQEFADIHSEHAHKMLREYHMGALVEESEEEVKEAAAADEAMRHGARPTTGAAATFLDPHIFKPCPLVQKETVSHDTKRFRFALPSPDQPLGLPVGHHLYLRAMVHDEMVMRPYTPTSLTHERGSFELVVKVYFAHQDPKHPQGGKMSQHLNRMRIGETIDVKGPMGRLVYHGRGWFEIKGSKHSPKHASRIGLVAGGTGITPMYQLLQTIHQDCFDDTQASLVFANRTPEDILLRPELDRLARKVPDQFKVWYTVDHVPLEHGPESWPFDIGHVNAEMLAAHLPPPGNDVLILMCGPPPFVEYGVKPNLVQKLGYDEDTMTYVF